MFAVQSHRLGLRPLQDHSPALWFWASEPSLSSLTCKMGFQDLPGSQH